MHTLLDLQGNIPSFIEITDAKLNDVNILDVLIPESGAIYVMDRGYVDYRRLHMLALLRQLLRGARQVKHQVPPDLLECQQSQ